MTEDLNQVLRARREKLRRLREEGIDPFPYRFERSHEAREARAELEAVEAADGLDSDGLGPSVRLAGRLVALRGHGGSAFADLEDESGRIQLHFRRDLLGEDSFERLDLADLGDWLGAEGHLFRTRRGEPTVRAARWEMLGKSLRPLPLGKAEVDEETGERRSWGDVADPEARYRQPYADLAVHPERRELFRGRAGIIAALRRFLDEAGFVEVETPALQPLYGGATARPFVTRHNALDRTMYLRIADELYLKRLIAGGFERVYEIAKDFRNEGVDRSHNPEFTMLEYYQAYTDYGDMMELTERLLSHVAREVTGGGRVTWREEEIDLAPPFARARYTELLEARLGVDPLEIEESEMRRRLEARGVPGVEEMGRGRLFDKLFSELVEDQLTGPVFVMDHPRELSPLAKRHRADPRLAERFELYVGGLELANAFSELTDPLEQRERFEEQAALAAAGDEEAHQVDEDYLRAMEYGMPPIGGVGVGVDRLAMILLGEPSIRDVILFPALRDASGRAPEEGGE